MPKQSNLQTIVKLLPELKPNELVEVRKRLQALTSITAPAPTKATDDWLENCITEELIRRGVSFGTDWKGRMPKGYRQQAEAVREFLTKAVTVNALPVRTQPLTSAEKYALGRVTARALADYLSWQEHFGLKVMLQQINKIPEALDASFPGYVASGMLGRLFKVRETP